MHLLVREKFFLVLIRLIIDATKVSAHHQLLMVAPAYRRRALPIAWTWVRKSRGHRSGHKQLALLNDVRSLITSTGSRDPGRR